MIEDFAEPDDCVGGDKNRLGASFQARGSNEVNEKVTCKGEKMGVSRAQKDIVNVLKAKKVRPAKKGRNDTSQSVLCNEGGPR